MYDPTAFAILITIGAIVFIALMIMVGFPILRFFAALLKFVGAAIRLILTALRRY